MRKTNPRRRSQSGFALLLVFALAAAVMVMLYLEMPRVAFEHQRNKEGMLVERGEQFMRAIALYHRKFAKLPQNIDELESTNNLRFLRRKYEDPFTGKDEWRLVHVDAAGQYVDSLVHKRQGQEENKGPSALAATIQGIGSQAEYTPGLGGDQEKNPALQRRASDRISPGMPGGAPGAGGESGDNEPAPEGRSGPAGGQTSPFEGVPGQIPGPAEPPPNIPSPGGGPIPPGGGPGGTNPISGRPGIPGTPGTPGGQPSTRQGIGTMPGGPQTNPQNPSSGGGFGFGGGGGFGSSLPQTPQPVAGQQQNQTPQLPPGSQFQGGQQAQRPGQMPDGALRAIGGIISGQQQRPGTGQGSTGAGGMGGSLPGAGGTGGLVGVASKSDFTGILVYNEKTNVKEWEFLYDLKKAAQAAAGQQGNPQGQNPLQPGGQNPMQPGGQNQRPSMSNPFGNTQGARPGGRP